MDNEKADSCRFCQSKNSLMPCIFCTGERLRLMRQSAANFILRRMGFAARESFDLHCAALKAAINNNAAVDGMDDNAKAEDVDKRSVENHTPFVDNRQQSCGEKFATMAAMFFGGGINAVSREEFDIHNQILNNAEKKRAQQTKKGDKQK